MLMRPLLLLAVVTLMFCVVVPASSLNLSFISSECNIKSIPGNSSLEANLGVVLDEIQRNTPLNNYVYKTHRTDGGTSAYGEGRCNAELEVAECADCLEYLKERIWAICNRAVGAKVQLGSCFIHYESYKF